MQLDVRVLGGSVLDGTGAPGRRADVGIVDGRVVVVGEPGSLGAAERTVDASGCVVAPGFVDVHTHYDAQVFWDAACTPSSLHGVTTVIAGNCGFSIAPLPDDADYLMRMLSRVEGIPLEALASGVPWGWRSFAGYLDAVEARGTAVNFGAMVGHSAVRRTALGERSHDAVLRAGELEAMQALVRDALDAGAFGFSSSWAATHVDGDGEPVPSRASGADELVALCSVLAGYAGAQLEFIPTNGPFDDAHVELLTRMALAADAPLNWNILIPRDRAITESRLRASAHARANGARVLALTYPDVIRSRVSFLSSGFDSIPGWAPVMALPLADKRAALGDRAVRARLREGADSVARTGPPGARYAEFVIAETVDPANEPLRGRVVCDVAAQLGQDPFDVLVDVALRDDLRTRFVPPLLAADAEGWEMRRLTWQHPDVVLGASDGGAHLDMLTTFDYAVRALALARDHDELSLPDVVRKLTDVPARLYGLRERGRLAPGFAADVVVFDPATVDAGPVEWRDDLPAGASRLFATPVGVRAVLVNGVEIVHEGALTGARPGTVLRRGR